MIVTREELIIALSEAAEVEHGLLVQYLFAAFSIERRDIPDLSPSQQICLARWQKIIFDVAREEMDHLAKVCNLLAAIGSAPQFLRPNFPQSNTSFFLLGVGKNKHHRYPFDFELERFNDCSLYRFIISELPKGVTYLAFPNETGIRIATARDGSPQPIVYNHVGELYSIIEKGFIDLTNLIGEKELFIGGIRNQDNSLDLVKDLNSARRVINRIIVDGEGTPDDNKDSHYEKFMRVRSELAKELKQSSSFNPSKNVALNPQTRYNGDSRGNVTLITHGVTLKLAELFNDIYITMLSTLIQYHSQAGETDRQIEALTRISRGVMSTMLRPLAEMLTEMPVHEEQTDLVAGPCFEIYHPIRLSPDVQSRWKILKERITQEIGLCESLLDFANTYTGLKRLNSVYENLKYLLLDVETVS
ncbi:ferritin-like protein [Dyadobacter chenhuakuii]|uniref:Ferritin-like protein n=1 Tax=Dyadobacter chenhuakuii TaxID=2909339 RepID=A0ABY4XMW4_9BACT|nr:ferritin-like protein [Dyadobacter chenhuakuii]MCF2494304.1 ferritin-like protein [Dyadobacter chenhuakuii]USJ31428.1 ferritin-like protein [Dyadobacter chenhuakuii]